MGRIFQPLLFLLARCIRNELIRQIEQLKAENEMLRKRIDKKRIFLDREEKSQLMKLGQAMGSDLKHIINIVSYNTYQGWLRKGARVDIELHRQKFNCPWRLLAMKSGRHDYHPIDRRRLGNR